MKKTVSMLLAILVAAITVCTFATSAFADTTTTVASNGITDPNDGRLDPTTTTTKATTTATTAAPTTTEASATTAASTTAKETTTEKVVTLPSGVTVIDEGSTKAPTTKKPTTKKPAANVSTIPSTGSSVAAPVIALLALAAGTVAVVKTKKDN